MTARGATARSRRASARCATKNVLQPAAAKADATGSTPQPYASALTTAAQSAGAERLASVRQFCTTAVQSIVRRAPTSAAGRVVPVPIAGEGAVAASLSGRATRGGGRSTTDSGSDTAAGGSV